MNYFAGIDVMARACLLPIDKHRAFFYGSLYFVASCILDVVREKYIESLFLLARRNNDFNFVGHCMVNSYG